MREELDNSPRKYLRRFIFRNGRKKAVGFKFKYEEMSNPLFLDARNFIQLKKDIHIIQLRRNNLWERFLSEYAALNLTKTFNSQTNEIVIPDKAITIDPKIVEDALIKSEKWNQIFKKAFKFHPLHECCYEDFLEDPDTQFNAITDFLSVSKINFVPKTKKIDTTKNIEKNIINLNEIIDYFQPTKFKSFFNNEFKK